MKINVFSVSQINRYIHNLFQNDFVLHDFCVKGEISNFKAHSSGHFYFTLKDSSASIYCIMFRGEAEMLPFLPENGMFVIVMGSVTLYEKTGQYQIIVQWIEPVGLGSAALSLQQLKNKLEKEGLFDEEYKREICKQPKCIAVVTSPTGAAVKDVIQIINRRNKTVKIVVVPVLVQGEHAPKSIVQGIKLANQWGQADTIILARGGGSNEDLEAFNDERVARAIFASELPVISAVGHQTDYTIADFVSDLRVPTPSAAAEMAVENTQYFYEHLQSITNALHAAANRILSDYKKRLAIKQLKQPLHTLQKHKYQLEQFQKTIQKGLLLQTKQIQYETLKKRLENASYFSILKRGYILAKNEKGDTITSLQTIQKGERITLYFQDGSAKVELIEKNEKIEEK